MTEFLSPPNPEQEHEGWVAMRPDGLQTTHREEYGLIGWIPKEIPYGRELEINTDRINSIFHLLSLTFPVEIRAFTPPGEKPVIVEAEDISANGEAAMSAKATQVKEPKIKTFGEYCEETGHYELFINFGGFADAVESKLPDGKANSNFYAKYAQKVNGALLQALPDIVQENIRNYDPKIREEAVNNMLALVGTSVLEIPFICGRSSFVNPEEMITELAKIIITYNFIRLAIKVFPDSSNHSPIDIRQHIKSNFTAEKIAQFLLHDAYLKYSIIPFFTLLTPKSRLIRAKSHADSGLRPT